MPKWIKKINNVISAQLTNDSTGELFIHGDITDESWWDDEVTPKSIKNALDDMGSAKEILLHINSYGGSVFAGNCIINLISAKKKAINCKVIAYIEGIAASMGSGIAMVADEIIMYDNALMMLHKPLSLAFGNANDFQKTIDMLNKAEETLIKNYMRHFNGTEDELRNIMSEESWFTSDECLENGLCTSIEKSVSIVASAKGFKVNDIVFNQRINDIILNKKLKIDEEKEDKMVYNKNLEQYGITQEKFDTMKPQDVIDKMCEMTISQPKEKELTDKEICDHLKVEDIEVVKNAILENETLKATILDQKLLVDKYEKMKTATIEDALKNGIKAKGEKFDNEKWSKRFAGYELEEIQDYSSDWKEEAELSLNAGKRVSEPQDTFTKKVKDINDMNF